MNQNMTDVVRVPALVLVDGIDAQIQLHILRQELKGLPSEIVERRHAQSLRADLATGLGLFEPPGRRRIMCSRPVRRR